MTFRTDDPRSNKQVALVTDTKYKLPVFVYSNEVITIQKGAKIHVEGRIIDSKTKVMFEILSSRNIKVLENVEKLSESALKIISKTPKRRENNNNVEAQEDILKTEARKVI